MPGGDPLTAFARQSGECLRMVSWRGRDGDPWWGPQCRTEDVPGWYNEALAPWIAERPHQNTWDTQDDRLIPRWVCATLFGWGSGYGPLGGWSDNVLRRVDAERFAALSPGDHTALRAAWELGGIEAARMLYKSLTGAP